mgnify:CR=1 FL=1
MGSFERHSSCHVLGCLEDLGLREVCSLGLDVQFASSSRYLEEKAPEKSPGLLPVDPHHPAV